MAIPQNRLSTSTDEAPYLDPDGRSYTANEDWEAGPVAISDTSEGAYYQPWKLTFENGDFIITPETTGPPVTVLTGQDSIQCTFAFDQNGRPAIAWQDNVFQGHLYWFDTDVSQFVITDFAQPVYGLALTLDDKRSKQFQQNDILLWYTQPSAMPGLYTLYHRRQRDRYDTPFTMLNPVKPYIIKCGMNEEFRVQLSMGNLLL